MTTRVVLVLLLLAAEPAAQEAPRRKPVRLRNEVHVYIEERPDEEFPHDYYEQPYPSEYESRVRRGASLLSSSIEFRTACRPQEEDRDPAMPPPPPPAPPTLTLSAAFSFPRMNVSIPKDTTVQVGNARRDPIITTSFSGTGGSAGGSGTLTSSDQPFLYGPDLDLVLARDLSGWGGTAWLPQGSSLHAYGRALYGSFEVFDTPARLELYGVGPRLGIPLWGSGGLALAAQLSAGPAYLKTEIGDALGFDAGVGLRAEQIVSGSLSLMLSIEATLFLSDNVAAWGPLLNFGVNLSW